MSLQTWPLKTAFGYCPTASEKQESRPSLESSERLWSRCLWGLSSHQRTWLRKDPLLSSDSCWEHLVSYRLLDWGPQFLAGWQLGGHPLFLAMWPSSNTNWQHGRFLLQSYQRREFPCKIGVVNTITQVTSQHLCHILLVRSKLEIWLTLKGKGLQGHEY